jgi:hypothetical protein
MLVALLRCFSGSLLAAMDIKTILSIPRMISKSVRVINAIMASEVNKKSNIIVI